MRRQAQTWQETMLLEDLNWISVEKYLERDDRVVVITGACEQHGYLSLLSDIRIPLEVAQEACKREGVLIAPPLAYGISPYFTTFPGTLSLKVETFATVVRELIEGLLAQGFQRVLVSNGHGGNTGVLYPLLVELGNSHSGSRLALFHWWREPAVEAVAQQAGLPQDHANWAECFEFTRVGPLPEGNKEQVDVSRASSADEFRAALGDGSFGGPYQAPDEVTQHLFEAAVAAMVTALQEL